MSTMRKRRFTVFIVKSVSEGHVGCKGASSFHASTFPSFDQAQAALEMAKEAAAEGGKKSRDTQLPGMRSAFQMLGSFCIWLLRVL